MSDPGIELGSVGMGVTDGVDRDPVADPTGSVDSNFSLTGGRANRGQLGD